MRVMTHGLTVGVVGLVLLGSFPVRAEITEPLAAWERQALIDLYNALDGDHWVDNSGWKDESGNFRPAGTEDSWHGVELDYVGEQVPGMAPSVAWLAFSDNHLQGDLAGLLEPFANLRSLTFIREPGLTGQLPNLWGHEHLRHISFVDCGITGGLPMQGGIALLPHDLRELTLDGCPVSLDWNQLLGIRSCLQTLDVGDVPVGGVLPDLRVEFPCLTVLDLQHTGLSGALPALLPAGITQLFLSGNALEGPLPAGWGEASGLTILHVDGNRLSGELPATLRQLTNLVSNGGLDLDWNALTTSDSDLWSFLLDKHRPITLPDGTFLGDWRERQSAPPSQVNGWPTNDGRLRISWTDAPNGNWQDGYYLVEHSVDGMTWTPLLTTSDRSTTEAFLPLDDRRVHDHFRVTTATRPFALNANEVLSQPRANRHDNALFYDDFESPRGWTLLGDFAIGEPQAGNGAGTAWNGANLLGSDLAGAHLDNQAEGMAVAVSPSFSCAGKSHIKLAFRSFSQFDGFSGDMGSVDVSVGGGAWQTLEVLNHYFEQGWERHWIDLSPWADNQADVRVRLAYTSDNSFGLDGWNVDDVLVLSRPAASGIYTVDPAGVGSNNFTSLQAAMEFVNARELSGPLALDLARGAVFDEELEPLFVKGEAGRELTLTSSGPGAKPVLRAQGGESMWDAVLKLRGARHLRIENIDIEPGAQVEHGVQLANRTSTEGCSDITIADLSIHGGRYAGVASSTWFAPLSDEGANSRIAVERVEVGDLPAGVLLDNNWNNEHLDADNRVSACVLGSSEHPLGGVEEMGRGVKAQGQNGLRVEGNQVSHVRGFIATGLELDGHNLFVSGNRLHDIGGGWRATGIQSTGGKIWNNMVALEDSVEGAEIVGILLADGASGYVDFNSVRVRGLAQSTSDGLRLPDNSWTRVSNNILANLTPDQEEGWHHAALSVNGTPYFQNNAALCDANLLLVSAGGQGGVGYDRSVQWPYATLEEWRASTGADLVSVTGDPGFVSGSDLHLRSGSPTPAESAGMWLQGQANYPWITADLDGEARSTSQPDIGADEGEFAQAGDPPYTPYQMSPNDGEPSAMIMPTLSASWSWDNTHPVLWSEFYCGTDSAAVAACSQEVRVLADGTAQSRWTPSSPLAGGTRHFWQVRVGNWSGHADSGVRSFTTENLVTELPLCAGFDDQVPPDGWRICSNSEFDGGLDGGNLMPVMWGGWMRTEDPQYVGAGTSAAWVHGWQMPAWYWLMTPPLQMPQGGRLSFRLHFMHDEGQATRCALMAQTSAGWNVLRSWDGPEDACGLETVQQVELASGGFLRLAFVYLAGNGGSPVALDDVCITGGLPLDAPQLAISRVASGDLRLVWTAIPAATAYRVESATEADGPWSTLQTTDSGVTSLELPAEPGRRFFRVVALD